MFPHGASGDDQQPRRSHRGQKAGETPGNTQFWMDWYSDRLMCSKRRGNEGKSDKEKTKEWRLEQQEPKQSKASLIKLKSINSIKDFIQFTNPKCHWNMSATHYCIDWTQCTYENTGGCTCTQLRSIQYIQHKCLYTVYAIYTTQVLIHCIYNLLDYVYEQDYTVYTVYTTQVLIHCIYNLRDYVYEQDYTVYTTQVLIYSIYNLRDYVYNQANVVYTV